MTANVALISGMHETLRLLSRTSDQIEVQTDQLSTGRKISSGLDGAAYFTAVDLTHKSQDLVQRKDDMQQAIQTVKAASAAAATIGDLLEQARGLAQAASELDDAGPSRAARRAYATQFDSVVRQINDLAESSGFMNHNVALSDRQEVITQSTLLTGMGNPDVYTREGFSDFSVSVRGDGLISLDEQEAYEAEKTLGVSNLSATGFHTASSGTFSEIGITVSGKTGGSRSVSVTESGETVTMSFSASDLATRSQHFSGSFSSGAKVDFDLDLSLLDAASETSGGNVLHATLTKRVNLRTIVRDSTTQEEQIRDGSGQENRILDGENTFRFSQSALRLRLDQSRIMSASSVSGPVVSAVYGSGAQAVVGAPQLQGTASRNVADQSYHLLIEGTGADTATMSSSVLQGNVSAVAQVNEYTTAGLANGETARLTINGSLFTVTAGAGGLTATNVRDSFDAQLSGSGLPVTVALTAANRFTVTSATAGTGFSSSTAGSTAGRLSETTTTSNVSAIAQVNRVSLSSVVEIGETYAIGINGTNYSYTSASGDTAATVASHLATLASADPAVTASAGADYVDITASTAGVAFTQTESVTNLAFHAQLTLSNASGSNVQVVTNPSGLTAVTFSAAYGDGITGVAMTFDPTKLGRDLLSGRNMAEFQVRFSQDGDGDGRIASNTVIDTGVNIPYEVRLDDRPSDALTVQSNDLRARGLGLDWAANQWRDKADVAAALKQCASAVEAARSAASSYNSTLGVLQTRNDFAGGFSGVLEEGAAKLTQVDQNQASASLLMLQTRRQLGVLSLSLAQKSQQSILRLF